MTRKLGLLLVGALSIGSGCSKTTIAAEPTVQPESLPGTAAVRPTLVVLVVLDQFASWIFDKHVPLLPDDSVIRRAHGAGAYHVAEFPFASTQTAPGHASLTTGVTPAEHGIVANAVYDRELGARKTVDDRKHVVIGNEERYASPTSLRAQTVADSLYQHTGGKARIVGISIKGRSAVLPVGQRADIAVFYDARAHVMTTSTYYASKGKLPAWLVAFNKANPVKALLQPWEPEDPEWLQKHFGSDASPGEMYPTFPHDPNAAPDAWYAFSFTPESSEYLMAAAFAVVKAERMGIDDVPDFLALSVSGTDMVGHVWGARSWEYADNLRRIDRSLTRFVKLLEARSPVAFVLTADHGVAHLPERVRAGGEAGRLKSKEVIGAAERAADAVLGDGDWIAGYVPPLLTYTEEGKKRSKELTKALVKAMPKIRGVHAVYNALDGAKHRASNREIQRLVGASLPDDPPGDLYLVTEQGWFDALSEDGGTNHGTPWDYDRRIPVLMWGAGIERKTSKRAHNALQVATTLAALLDVPPPAKAPQSPLPGVMRLPD